tara:strand:+ start:416 stop:901 length:486 start_codon:yes stop_codon:yes gene_type:complete
MAAKYSGIKPSKFDDEIKKKLNKLLTFAVIETDSRLKQESPVDTGRFRNSWQIGENAIGTNFDGGPGGGIKPPEGLNYSVGNEKIGNSYVIHNSLPYAAKLATAAGGSGSKTEHRYNPKRQVKTWGASGEGSSIQTGGPGWVDGIAKDMQGWVAKEAKKLK